MTVSVETWALGLAVLFGAGIWLLAHGVLTFFMDLAEGLWRFLARVIRPGSVRLRQMATDARASQETYQGTTPGMINATIMSVFRFPVPVLISAVAAIFVNDWMISALVVVIGVAVSFSLYSRLRRASYNRLTDELEMLILQFVARYPLRNSVATALAEAADEVPSGLLNQSAGNTATRLKLGDNQDPYRELISVPHPIARRFAGVLIRATQASPDVFLDLLGQLRKETESRRELQQRIRRDLTLESMTISVLQVFLIVSLGAVALLPSWRDYYVFSLGNRVIYMAMVGMGVIGTIIGEYEIRYLEES
jgi:hypothetical protein